MTSAVDRGPPRGPMRRSLAVVLVALSLGSAACGATGQYFYGFTERQTRTTQRTRSVRVERPTGARVERVDAEGRTTPVPGAVDILSFDIEETVEVPRSRVPMYIGTALDLVGVFGFGWALRNHDDDDTRGPLIYGFGYSVAAFIGDLAFSVYYSTKTEPEIVAYAPVAPKPMTYYGHLGEETRRARVDVTMQDTVALDFARPAEPTDALQARADAEPIEPGGPRLAEPEPAFYPRKKPPPPPEESWYGWQLLPLDILAVSTLIYATKEGDLRLAGLAATVNLASGPLIHLAHGRAETAGGSLGLRAGPALGAAALGAVVGFLVSPILFAYGAEQSLLEIMGTAALYLGAYGFVIGAPVVALLDAAALGWEVDEDEDEAPAVQIVPSAGRTVDGAATFGIAGRF